ncbi:D-aminoacylase, partial [Candidatus Bathyarchaeota archaeon]
PGFIDIHAHSELAYFTYPKAESKVKQGVTTELNCNCGISPTGPLKGLALDELKSRVDLKAARKLDFRIEWRTLEEYTKLLEKRGVSVNCAFQVGFGTVRVSVMGYDNREPTKDELDEMKALVAQGMEEGAFGLSTGLKCAPQNFAKTDEIVELAKVAAEYGGIYSTHRRRRGYEWGRPPIRPLPEENFLIPLLDTPFESTREAIEIGKRAKIPVHIVHYKLPGKRLWGRVKEELRMISDARKRGIDVTLDTSYPYNAKGADLAWIPTWAMAEGTKKLIERLKGDQKFRERLKKEVKENMEGFNAEYGWEDSLILDVKLEKNKDLIGKSAAEAARIRGKDPCDLWFDLLIEGEDIWGVAFAMSEDDLREVIRYPYTMISSDASVTEPVETAVSRHHPREYAVFPRFIRKYVIEENLLTMEEAVRRITSAPASRLGLMDRGLIRPGFWADIVVFDPINLREKATYKDPVQYPEGIEYVIVNGVITVEKGKHTGALAGKPLKHQVELP